jgi:hypothetical protein
MKPYAWTVTGTARLFWDEHEASREARHCGGTAKAVALYHEDAVREILHLMWKDALKYMNPRTSDEESMKIRERWVQAGLV